MLFRSNDRLKQVRVFKNKAGKPIGEIGYDLDSGSDNPDWYCHHYATGYRVLGFDDAREATTELKYVHQHPEAVNEMDKSQPSQERHGDYPLGIKNKDANMVKPTTKKRVVKDLTKVLNKEFDKEVKEEHEDPVFNSHTIKVVYPEGAGRSHNYHRREPYRLSTIFSDANSVAARNRRAQIDLYVDGEIGRAHV